MKCKKQPPFPIKEPIAHVLDVLIDDKTWAKIKKLASQNKTTYSFVVRSCVLRSLKRKNFEKVKQTMEAHSKELKVTRKNAHRHQLCLYAEDEFALRLIALMLQSNLSLLIRTSLILWLHRINSFLLKRVIGFQFLGSGEEYQVLLQIYKNILKKEVT